jgi:large subunit ribosomal protein L17
VVKDREILRKLFSDYAEQFKDRPGGYTRITKIGRRPGDNAPMSIIELVEEPYEPKAGGTKAGPAKAAAAAAAEAAPEADESADGGAMDDLLSETDEG